MYCLYRICALAFAVLLVFEAQGSRLKSDKDVLDVCMDGRHHYENPVTTRLYGICKPWESKSCCSNETAFHSQKPFTPLYNLNLSHCGEMSEKCLRRFYLSGCFYECSPNVGPWLVPDKSSIRNEKFYDVPLCQSDCEGWWNDCKDELTCVDNFAKGFKWINGTNHCPTESKCDIFEKWFHNATYFCENIYPHDFKVVKNDSTACIKLDINGSQTENPNAKMAEYYAKKKGLYNPNDASSTTTQKVPPQSVTVPNNGSTVSPNSTAETTVEGNSKTTLIVLALIVVVLLIISLAVCIYKCRDAVETSKRAGTRYFPRFNWFKRASTSAHSVVHHQALNEDRQFLREPDDEEDSDIMNPDGALEIDL